MTACSSIALALAVSAAALAAPPAKERYPNFPSETPTHFVRATQSFDYIRREVMIPMRDGVKLHTEIMIPKGVSHAGIVLTRTPYTAAHMTSAGNSSRQPTAITTSPVTRHFL